MTKNPHNALFKHVFSQPEHAAGELRAVLDPALSARIDWGRLALCPGSFVDEALTESHTDLLFSGWLDGEPVLLYFLFEHLSTSQPLVPYRMLRYEVKIWEDWIAKNPAARKLPVILPVVLHHSVSGWQGPTRFEELVDVSQAVLEIIAPHVPRFGVMLDDISKATDEKLRRRAMSALGTLALVLLRDARRSGGLGPTLQRFTDLLSEVWHAPHRERATRIVLRYIFATSKLTKRSHRNDIRGAVREILGPLDEEAMPNLLEEGSEVYKEDGVREALVHLIEKRFGPPDAAVLERIDDAELPTLKGCLDRILTAATVEEVLGGSPSPATA